jgi:hypothetical protein
MLFSVRNPGPLPNSSRGRFFLIRDQWNDWFEWVTQFRLVFLDEKGETRSIGELKIGQVGLTPEQRSPALPETFDALDLDFFSVGQDESYYENLKNLGTALRVQVLTALRDIALDESLFQKIRSEEVTQRSLLRSVTASAVTGQIRRMARGDARCVSSVLVAFVRPPTDRARVSSQTRITPANQRTRDRWKEWRW